MLISGSLFLAALVTGAAAREMDILAYFQQAAETRGTGLARKTRPVDARPAKPGEIVVTVIKGEGEETRSAPAKAGDMVVRNRCPDTGDEQILVSAEKFAERYEGPVSHEDNGWRVYRPRGVDMHFVVVPEAEREFTFKAPWGEQMVAKPGDIIVQDPAKPADTYRISRAAFACTYEVLRAPSR